MGDLLRFPWVRLPAQTPSTTPQLVTLQDGRPSCLQHNWPWINCAENRQLDEKGLEQERYQSSNLGFPSKFS